MSKLLLKVRDIEIYSDSLYTITPKPDADAPDGLVNLGTTKIPSATVANDVPCRWVMTNKANGTGLYDTGLYTASPCYTTMNKEVVAERVELIIKNLVEPYEAKHQEGQLHHSNSEEFWDSYRVRLNDGRILSTNKVDDLLDLFIALNSYALTPKQHVGNPAYKGSQYCVEDSTKVQNFKNENSTRKVEAIGHYMTLRTENPTKLNNLLRYVGVIGFDSEVSLDSLNSVVLDWLEATEQNPIRFEEAYKLSKGKTTQNIIDYYGMLGTLTKTGVVSRVDGVYRYQNTDLGVDLKVAAKFLNGKSKQAKALAIELTEIFNKE